MDVQCLPKKTASENNPNSQFLSSRRSNPSYESTQKHNPSICYNTTVTTMCQCSLRGSRAKAKGCSRLNSLPTTTAMPTYFKQYTWKIRQPTVHRTLTMPSSVQIGEVATFRRRGENQCCCCCRKHGLLTEVVRLVHWVHVSFVRWM